MKTYLRILRYARPLADFVPLYLLYTVLGIFFSIGNFTLIIPLLNVLFDKTGTVQTEAPAALPHFAVSAGLRDARRSTTTSRRLLPTDGKLGALAVCVHVWWWCRCFSATCFGT